jgi:hypothetical protein
MVQYTFQIAMANLGWTLGIVITEHEPVTDEKN